MVLMTNTNPADLTVANTILQQLGGRRFMAMTGARDFVGSAVALTFKLPAQANDGIRCVRVTLTAMDDYTVEFLGRGPRGLTWPVKATREGVYAENLAEVFTRVTGLYTRL